MDFQDLVQTRYSCRDYLDRPVEEEKLRLVLEAARMAPTAADRQPFRLVVVRDPMVRERMSEVYMRHWFYSAPVIICACGIRTEAWVRNDHRHYTDVDAAIVMDHLILQAADLGLGTCWVADFDEEAARHVLHLPRNVEPVVLTPLGYPAPTPEGRLKTKRRRPLEELIHWDRFELPLHLEHE